MPVLLIVAVAGLVFSMAWRERVAKIACGVFVVALLIVLWVAGVR